jgi:hypothetical protein
MSASKPSLDDLISTQRASGGMTDAQRARNRAQLLSRALSGTAASAASVSAASSLTGAAPSGALGLVAKVGLCVVLLGGAGAGYLALRGAADRPTSATAAHSPEAEVIQPAVAVAPSATLSAVELASAKPLASAVLPVPSAKPRVPRSTSSSTASSLAAEVALMHEVDAALRARNPTGALTLLDEQGNGAGFMAEERAVAHIVTLCQLGRVDQARAEATRFLHDRPRSPLAARVRATCAKPTESVKPD